MEIPNSFEHAAKLKEYYPNGFMQDFPVQIEGYQKYPKVLKVIDEKIKAIQKEEKENIFFTLKRELEKHYKYDQINDLRYYRAPDLFFKVRLDNVEQKEMLWGKNLCIGVSLLIPYYTVFFEIEMATDRFETKDNRNGFNFFARAKFPRKVIIFGEENASSSEKSILKDVKTIISESHPENAFLHHYSIFKRNVYSDVCSRDETIQQITINYRYSKYLFGSYEFGLFEKDGFEVFK